MFKNEDRNNILRPDILKRFISGVMTDDERAKLYNLPEGCRIREGAKIISPENFNCGKYVWIGENAILDASGGLEIGNHVSVGLSVFIWSHNSYLANLAMDNKIGSELITRKSTKIGNGCFIGGPSVIYSGVTIGDKVVILPMSVVTKSFKNNCVIAGNPARIIKELSDEEIKKEIDKVTTKYGN